MEDLLVFPKTGRFECKTGDVETALLRPEGILGVSLPCAPPLHIKLVPEQVPDELIPKIPGTGLIWKPKVSPKCSSQCSSDMIICYSSLLCLQSLMILLVSVCVRNLVWRFCTYTEAFAVTRQRGRVGAC